MAANGIADPRVDERISTVAIASASADTGASEIMVGILSVHYMVSEIPDGRARARGNLCGMPVVRQVRFAK